MKDNEGTQGRASVRRSATILVIGVLAILGCRNREEPAGLLESAAYGQEAPQVAYAVCDKGGAPTYHVAVDTTTGVMTLSMLGANNATDAQITGHYVKIVVGKPVPGLEYNVGTFYKLAAELKTIRSFVYTSRRVLSPDHTQLIDERTLWLEAAGAGEPERLACKEVQTPAGPISAGVSN
jgi:hypothetical protein